jgi:redox-sensitive bicupin YhaK (pirin superfamily)
MSGTFPANEPACADADGSALELIIEARPRDIGGFAVRRALPSMRRRHAGPFVFFDQMGPADFVPGTGLDVRPHPHIGLATVTYLFDGAIDHRDSLGTLQTIVPGDVNWMVAGRGVVHSERSNAACRARGDRVHGIQSWVALPLGDELCAPRFEHHARATIPRVELGGATLEVVAGAAYGACSPVSVLSPTLYVHARLVGGATLPIDDAYEERAVYVIEGVVSCDGRSLSVGTMALLRAGARVTIEAGEAARVMLVGGAKLEGERHIYWNFVSSSKERIERAKDDWRSGRFSRVPGDEREFIPLPE